MDEFFFFNRAEKKVIMAFTNQTSLPVDLVGEFCR